MMMVMRWYWWFYSYLILFFLPLHQGKKWNVALHGQIEPTSDRIVGSVITTDGLYQAFQSRQDIEKLKTFYPFSYFQYLDSSWDILLIEGWFISIIEFLHYTRLTHPHLIILFLCLDPSFPGLDVISSLPIDGILTNSYSVLKNFLLEGLPSQYLLLAADPNTMQPIPTIPRNISTLFLGAGGPMLAYKPELSDMLSIAKQYGLAIYGQRWDGTIWEENWRGVLPRHAIAEAYASTEIVLASTIASQDKVGMINNRLFEALACGAIVVTKWSSTIEEMFGHEELVFTYNTTNELSSLFEMILSQSEEWKEEKRKKAREWILNGHTWSHRIPTILDMASQLRSRRYQLVQSQNSKVTKGLKTLWIVSRDIQEHGDVVQVVQHHLFGRLQMYLDIEQISEDTFYRQYIASNESCVSTTSSCPVVMEKLSNYEVIFVVAVCGDQLDRTIQQLPLLESINRDMYQRRAIYLFPRKVSEELMLLDSQRYDVYDTIFYRDSYDLKVFESMGIVLDENRIQHAFGVDVVEEKIPHDDPVIICFKMFQSLCQESIRERFLVTHYNKQDDQEQVVPRYWLVLIGGEMSEWTSYLPSLQLSRTLLISNGSLDLLAPLLHRNGKVFFMNGPTNNLEEIASFILAIQSWSFIHLFQPNDHFQHLVNETSLSWNAESYLVQAVSTGLQRLLCMALSSSRFRVELAYPPNPLPRDESSPLPIVSIERIEARLPRLLQLRGVPIDSWISLVKLSFENFKPGRDGILCLIRLLNETGEVEPTNDNTLCYLYPNDWLLLVFSPKLNSTTLPTPQSQRILFSLQGNMVRNRLVVANLTLPVRSIREELVKFAEEDDSITPEDAIMNQQWLNNMFQFEI